MSLSFSVRIYFNFTLELKLNHIHLLICWIKLDFLLSKLKNLFYSLRFFSTGVFYWRFYVRPLHQERDAAVVTAVSQSSTFGRCAWHAKLPWSGVSVGLCVCVCRRRCVERVMGSPVPSCRLMGRWREWKPDGKMQECTEQIRVHQAALVGLHRFWLFTHCLYACLNFQQDLFNFTISWGVSEILTG